MKINEKSENKKITIGWKNSSSQAQYQIGKKDFSQFNLISFHPAGEPEAFICCVIRGSA
jgi:hypothetical protein